jgi:molybdate transport system substrate-binding protein
MRLYAAAVAALLVGVSVAGCGSGSAAAPEQKTLTVLAAASLTESFGALEKKFEAEHAGVDVKISFQGSSALAQQIINGGKADVFASADETNMKKVTDAGLANGSAEIFATNQLAIAVPPGNPKKIASLADLAKDGTIVVVCAPQVPCGSAAQKVEKAAGVTVKPKSEEQDVKAVLTKVAAGEADAGLVYVTDINSAAGKVVGVDFAEAAQAINKYPIAALKDAPQADLAKAFVQFVRGDAGRAELTKVGFKIP